MKALLFFRHGKSDWTAAFDHDHERPLNKRGRKAARVMGQLMTTLEQVPDMIVCSTALRARQTLELAREGGGWDVPERTTDALYGASPEQVLAEIRTEPDATELLMLVGHEPTWSETVSRLVGGGRIRFPTAAMARVDVAVEQWQQVAFGRGQLIWLIPPRLFS